jgi:hypothetical protein
MVTAPVEAISCVELVPFLEMLIPLNALMVLSTCPARSCPSLMGGSLLSGVLSHV